MRSAVIVVDMLKSALQGEREYPVSGPARAIVPTINRLTAWAREKDYPVVFACDSFLPGDFIFRGRMKPHSLRGTPGSEPADSLERSPQDTVLYKRRFSAFFKTDLDQTLRTWGVERVLCCGIATHFCVWATVLDALSHDFQAVLVEDACADPQPELARMLLAGLRRNPLEPLLRVVTLEQLLTEP